MKTTILAIALLFSSQITNVKNTAGGITMPTSIQLEKTTLVLNGIGVREKMWIDLYVAGLYLKTQTKDPKKIVNIDEKMSLKLHIVSSLVSSEKMSASMEESFTVSTGGNLKSLRTRIDAFKAIFLKKQIVEGVEYDISYLPGKGTVVHTNGVYQATIKGLDFKKALFNIWFGTVPADEDLKKNLLNKQ